MHRNTSSSKVQEMTKFTLGFDWQLWVNPGNRNLVRHHHRYMCSVLNLVLCMLKNNVENINQAICLKWRYNVHLVTQSQTVWKIFWMTNQMDQLCIYWSHNSMLFEHLILQQNIFYNQTPISHLFLMSLRLTLLLDTTTGEVNDMRSSLGVKSWVWVVFSKGSLVAHDASDIGMRDTFNSKLNYLIWTI